MAWSITKLNRIVILVISIHQLAEAATNYVSDNSITANDGSQQNIYPGISQAVFIPFAKYVQPSSEKYITQTENQIPVIVTSTEKPVLSSAYTLDATKYDTSQVAKPPRNAYDNQGSHPYVYTLAKAAPTAPTGTSDSSIGHGFQEEIPKKYHFGYRVSNPTTGTEFGHSEVSDGVSTKGYYHVLLPDGRLQNVKYWAGPLGYHATITYENPF